jgi:hypothetical protein
MKTILISGLCAAASLATPLFAADFSAGSTAKSWNLYAEKKAFFKATVVDPLCTLTGSCPANCGDGKRQLALLRTSDNVMVLPLKNSQAAFTGAANELQPFCGKKVEVDGLLVEDEDLNGKNLYQLQKIRLEGDAKWTKANRWTKDWRAANPEAKGKGPWFRRDLRVKAAIAKDGYTGLGLETDKAFITEWFE